MSLDSYPRAYGNCSSKSVRSLRWLCKRALLGSGRWSSFWGDPCQAFFLFGVGELDWEMAWDPPFCTCSPQKYGPSGTADPHGRPKGAACTVPGSGWGGSWSCMQSAQMKTSDRNWPCPVGAESTGSGSQWGSRWDLDGVMTWFSRVQERPGPRLISDSSLVLNEAGSVF